MTPESNETHGRWQMSDRSSTPPFLMLQHAILTRIITTPGFGNTARLYLCLCRKALDHQGPGWTQEPLEYWCQELGWKLGRRGEVSRILAKLAKIGLVRLTLGKPDEKGASRKHPRIEIVGFEGWSVLLPIQATVQSKSSNGAVAEVGNGSVVELGNGFHSAPKKLKNTYNNSSSRSTATVVGQKAKRPKHSYGEEEEKLNFDKNNQVSAGKFKNSNRNVNNATATTKPTPPTKAYYELQLALNELGGVKSKEAPRLMTFASNAGQDDFISFLALVVEVRRRNENPGKFPRIDSLVTWALDSHRDGKLDLASDRARLRAKELYAKHFEGTPPTYRGRAKGAKQISACLRRAGVRP